MSTFLPMLLDSFYRYGYPALWLVIFAASVGAPLPVGLLLLATGALAALRHFSIIFLIGIALSASVCGDGLGYWIGRWWGSRVLDVMTQPRWHRLLSPYTLERSRRYFQRRGGLAIFLSRFLFSGLGGAINLLAGMELYPYRRFVLYDSVGETIGAAIPLVLGYTFATRWQTAGNVLGVFSGTTLVLGIGILVLIVVAKNMQRKCIGVASVNRSR